MKVIISGPKLYVCSILFSRRHIYHLMTTL
jgi:hypothetical protein